MDVFIISTLKLFPTQSLFSMESGSMGSQSGYGRKPVGNCLNGCLIRYLERPQQQNACAVLFLDGCYHRNEAFAYHTGTGLIADRCVTLQKHSNASVYDRSEVKNWGVASPEYLKSLL